MLDIVERAETEEMGTGWTGLRPTGWLVWTGGQIQSLVEKLGLLNLSFFRVPSRLPSDIELRQRAAEEEEAVSSIVEEVANNL